MKVTIIAGTYLYSHDGIGRYTQNLVNHLARFEGMSINTLGYGKPHKEYIPTVPKFPAFAHKIASPIIMELNYMKRFYHNNTLLSQKLKETTSDIYHAISPSEVVGAVKLRKKPLITTFHDVIPLLFKNRYLMEKFYFKYYSNVAKKSDVIVADSLSTKNDLIHLLNVDKNKISVIHPGIDTVRFHPVDNTPSQIKKIMYLGGLTKRKGIYETIYAFHKLLTMRTDVKLLIGGVGEELSRMQKKIAQLKIDKYVEYLGFVPETELPSLYNQADLFIYPSKYEGFGYTVLEALASGIPVITSNISSLPEVVGDAAITVDPTNIEEISTKMNYILDNENVQTELRQKGPKQASKYKWENSVSSLVKLYSSINKPSPQQADGVFRRRSE
jgi:glycosyltransferase involved in cell wall biosynthesis